MSLKSILEKSTTMVSCERGTGVQALAELMEDNNVGSVIVEENGQPVGMITDRDLVLRCLTQGEAGLGLSAEDVMSTPIETTSEDATIYDVIEQMNRRKIRRVCIVDNQGKCCGIVSSGDLIELIAKELGRLSEAMAPQQEKLIKESKIA